MPNLNARANGVQKASCMPKYRSDSLETGLWHINLYKKCGFNHRGPVGILLMSDLGRSYATSPHVESFEMTNCDDFSLEDLADFILRAYAETPEDREIHGWDPLVSNREQILRVLQSRRQGKTGSSQPDCCKAALVDGCLSAEA